MTNDAYGPSTGLVRSVEREELYRYLAAVVVAARGATKERKRLASQMIGFLHESARFASLLRWAVDNGPRWTPGAWAEWHERARIALKESGR